MRDLFIVDASGDICDDNGTRTDRSYNRQKKHGSTTEEKERAVTMKTQETWSGLYLADIADGDQLVAPDICYRCAFRM
jgi:basic membrane lipoprotein Med (substrate-binding protein (PBP1-ABC) superfamily)